MTIRNLRFCLPLGAIFVLLAGACHEQAGPESERNPAMAVDADDRAAPNLVRVVPALCEARSQARRDRIAAGRTFFDQAHHHLHLLADAAAREDRARARELLEAKARVEADLSGQVAASRLRADLGRLIEAASAALGALSVDAPPCPS